MATSLLTGLTFIVVAVTGIVAFVGGFDLRVIGLHSIMGLGFILLVAIHATNNAKPLMRYGRSRVLWLSLAATSLVASVVWWQPLPVKKLLSLSGNLGPAQERFQINEDHLIFQYSPADHYKMSVTVKMGPAYQVEQPPPVAIWLENQGSYHIKTLLTPDDSQESLLPYWQYKVAGWEKAKRDAEREERAVDGVTAATPNGSFDPADYILPADPENPMPYKLLIEINQPGDAHGPFDDQPSLVYAVEIDNSQPRTFQLLDLVGYPQREQGDDGEAWPLYYVNEDFGSALELIDSVLLTIDRTTLR